MGRESDRSIWRGNRRVRSLGTDATKEIVRKKRFILTVSLFPLPDGKSMLAEIGAQIARHEFLDLAKKRDWDSVLEWLRAAPELVNMAVYSTQGVGSRAVESLHFQ